jgi:hypothetical protein
MCVRFYTAMSPWHEATTKYLANAHVYRQVMKASRLVANARLGTETVNIRP